MTTTQTDLTKEAIAVGAFLSAMHDQGLDGAKVREAMLEMLGLSAALQEQAREGEVVANSAILARGRFHTFKGEDGEPDDWEWFEEGTNCEHGCIDAVIVRADAIAAPQPAQPEQGERAAQKAELLKNLTQWLDGLGRAIYTYSLRGIALHGFEKGWDAALQSAQPVALPLTPEELDLCRQWFDSIQDTNAEYLEPSDYLLAEKLYRQLNMRVPNSISEITKRGIGGGR